MMANQMSLLQYPAAAANAVILLIIGAAHRRRDPPRRRHPEGALSDARDERRGPAFWLLGAFFVLFVLFLYGPLSTIVILSFQGPRRRPHLPDERRVAALVRQPVREAGGRRFRRLVPPLAASSA